MKLWLPTEASTANVPHVSDLPESLLQALAPHAATRAVRGVEETALHDGTGAATEGVVRLVVDVDADGSTTRHRLIRKTFRPLSEGPHAAAARNPRHWGYWRREQLFYASGLAPRGPHVWAPRCIAVLDDHVYLEDVQAPSEDAHRAAGNLGRWQASSSCPDFDWLTHHQLSDRVRARDDLDWSTVNADPRAAEIWRSRERLLGLLTGVSTVISHGDFSIGNLRAGARGTLALDWATVGEAPLGADCATLALSTEEEVLPAYLHGLGGKFPAGEIRAGYYITLALTGASRMHWMLSRRIPVSVPYVDRIWDAYDHV